MAAAGGLILGSLALPAHAQIAVRNQGYVPFSEEPINYRSEVHDPVANLQKRLESGETSLKYEPQHGYLKSVLEQLAIPVSSQTLVFSKTSFQYKKISPQAPRALYFNDDVYVGQVHDGKVLEFVSFDAKQGAIFYILDEQKPNIPSSRGPSSIARNAMSRPGRAMCPECCSGPFIPIHRERKQSKHRRSSPGKRVL
jgi:hypothetical protein